MTSTTTTGCDPFYGLNGGFSPLANLQANISHIAPPTGARPVMASLAPGYGLGSSLGPPGYVPTTVGAPGLLAPTFSATTNFPTAVGGVYTPGVGVANVGVTNLGVANVGMANVGMANVGMANVGATTLGTQGVVQGYQTVQTSAPVVGSVQQQVKSNAPKNVSVSIPGIKSSAIDNLKQITDPLIDLCDNNSVKAAMGSGLNNDSTPTVQLSAPGLENVGAATVATGVPLSSGVPLATGVQLASGVQQVVGAVPTYGGFASGLVGAPLVSETLAYGLATPTSSCCPNIPGLPGVNLPELNVLTATPPVPNINLSPGLLFGTDPLRPEIPKLLQGPINPPLQVFQNNWGLTLDGGVPWWSGVTPSSPGAVFHDNNPVNPGTLIVTRDRSGTPVVTSIMPDPETGCPVATSCTPTKPHSLNCTCCECNAYCIDDADINDNNGPPSNSSLTVSSNTLIFELVNSMGSPNQEIIDSIACPTGCPVAIRVNKNPLGKSLVLKRGATYTVSFANVVDDSSFTTFCKDLIKMTRLVFTFSPIGGSYAVTGGIVTQPLFGNQINGIPQGATAFSLTVPLAFQGYSADEIVMGYYQSSNTNFAGGQILIIPA
jgi:hypothetical protein